MHRNGRGLLQACPMPELSLLKPSCYLADAGLCECSLQVLWLFGTDGSMLLLLELELSAVQVPEEIVV